MRAAKDAGYCSTATDVKKSSFGPFILLTIERLIKVTHTKINNIFLKLLLFLFNNILEKIIQPKYICFWYYTNRIQVLCHAFLLSFQT